MINLSKRLQAVAANIPIQKKFADIGSDHAYLPSYVCMKNVNMCAIAGEVQQGPYNAAKKTIEKYGLQDQIDVRLGNGLDVIQKVDQVKTIVIAGMGGKLIADILTQGREKLDDIDHLIVQPNTNTEKVRRFFLQNQYTIIKEEMVEENQHIYDIVTAVKATAKDPYVTSIDLEKQILFGPLLMQEKSAIFKKKWLREYEHTLAIIKQLEQSKMTSNTTMSFLDKRKAWMEEILR